MLEENLFSIKKEVEKETERERAKMTKRKERFSAHEINHSRAANLVFHTIYTFLFNLCDFFFNIIKVILYYA